MAKVKEGAVSCKFLQKRIVMTLLMPIYEELTNGLQREMAE